ncbi:MAG: hypothetical protein ABI693_03575 [Bryobacteraceae bacterium]
MLLAWAALRKLNASPDTDELLIAAWIAGGSMAEVTRASGLKTQQRSEIAEATPIMKFTIELDREVDGRWIAEVPALNILLYANSEKEAIQRAQASAREIVVDRSSHGRDGS